MIAVNQRSSRSLNEIVEAFETSRSQDADTDIQSFLPCEDNPDFDRIAIELMRVDLEHSWRDGQRKTIHDYQRRFRDVFAKQDNLRQLAYEEYRIRLLHGETVRREDYIRIGIDTKDWPDEANREEGEFVDDFGSLDQLRGELDRLVGSACEYPVDGETFGPYQIVAQIGQGAFSRVYLATDRDLANRLVVLKIGPFASTEHERLARLQHTNIVPIYSAQTVNHLSVICMPFFGLSTLADVVSHLGRMKIPPNSADVIPRALADKRAAGPECFSVPVSTSASFLFARKYETCCTAIMRRVAEGLAHAHDRGLLHRDIKPANILLADDGQPMLLDFNVSDDVVPGGTSSLTVGGTLPYMSPEQLRAIRTGDSIDARSDIYSLGVVFYELVTGRHPFSSHRISAASTQGRNGHNHIANESVADKVGRILRERENSVPDPRNAGAQISVGLASIIVKCLQPDAERRYANTSELLDDLRRHEEQRPLRFARGEPFYEKAGKWAKRHPRWTSATGVAIVAGVLIAALAVLALAQSRRAAGQSARQIVQTLHDGLPELRALFTAPDNQSNFAEEGYSVANHLLQSTNIRTPDGRDLAIDQWKPWSYLNHAEKERCRYDIAEVYYWLADTALRNLESPRPSSHQLSATDALRWNTMAASVFENDVPQAIRTQQERIRRVIAGEPIAITNGETEAERLSSLHASPESMLAAVEYLRNGNPEAAIRILRAVVSADPFNVSHRLALANACVAAGRLSEAEEEYTVSVSLNPQSFLSRFNRGLCRLDSKNAVGAVDDFTAALLLRPTSIEAQVNRALALKQMNNVHAAKADLDAAIRAHPDWPRLYFIRSRIKKAIGDRSGAALDREKGLSMTPKTEKDWIARGLALLKDDSEQAYECFQRALQHNPLSRAARRNLAHVVAEHRREPAAAMAILNELIQISPGNSDDIASRAVLHARMGNRQKAIDDIQRVLSKRNDGKAFFQGACVYALLSSNEFNQEQLDDKSIAIPDAEYAIGLLAKAIQADENWVNVAMHDPDLNSLRRRADFRSLVSAASRLRRAIGSAASKTESMSPPARSGISNDDSTRELQNIN